MKIKDLLEQNGSKIDDVSMSIPFLMRLLEWAREECKSDAELHVKVEAMIKKNKMLEMADYPGIFE